METLKEKVTDKLSRLFADSPQTSPHQGSSYSKEGRSWSSYFSYAIPSVSFSGSRKSNHQYDLKPVQVTYNHLEPQDDPSDEFVDCSPVCKSMDFLKDKIKDADQASGRGSCSSEVFEDANTPVTPQTPNSAKKALVNLTDESIFISPELYEFFDSCLPNIVKGCKWVLLYSTLKHGISLRTLIRKSAETPGPGLLIVGDKKGAVFGGLLECPLKPTTKRKYQGTPQSFVFTTIYGEPRLFRPTGVNRYYYMCLNDLLALGGGGNYALCLDGDLLNGTSGPCDTFGSVRVGSFGVLHMLLLTLRKADSFVCGYLYLYQQSSFLAFY